MKETKSDKNDVMYQWKETLGWVEEVEEGVCLYTLGEYPFSAPVFVFLNLLNHFHRHILTFLPLYFSASVGVNNFNMFKVLYGFYLS